MVANLLHRVVAHPLVYDQVQLLAGSREVQQRLAQQIKPVYSAPLVLDIGGGTGLVRKLFSPTSTYICLDNDPVKLSGFVLKHPEESALLANVSQIPIRSQSVDVVLCTNVSHHLPDALLDQATAEAMRLLKVGGRFIFLDAVWDPSRPISRLLWKYDRGRFPRSVAHLQEVLARCGTVIHREMFCIFHCYLLWVAEKSL